MKISKKMNHKYYDENLYLKEVFPQRLLKLFSHHFCSILCQKYHQEGLYLKEVFPQRLLKLFSHHFCAILCHKYHQEGLYLTEIFPQRLLKLFSHRFWAILTDDPTSPWIGGTLTCMSLRFNIHF